MGRRHGQRGQSGQASPEWIGTVLVVALAVAALAAAGARVPGTGLARAIAERLACAAGLGEGCGEQSELVLAYGAELASLVGSSAPAIHYEEGMRALPVDFRSCRDDPCSLGPESGAVGRSDAGEPVTAFVHVADCRPARPDPELECGGERAGNLYLQYWLYYPGSATGEGTIAPEAVRAASRRLGRPTHHADDWESFQVRIGPEGAASRASSHHGYNYRGGAGSWASDAGVVERSAWGPDTGRLHVSGGSHAGRVHDPLAELLDDRLGRRRARRVWRAGRWTPPGAITLVPIETLPPGSLATSFAVTPPWAKRVYLDPEHRGTD